MAKNKFYYSFHIDKENPSDFVKRMKNENRYISGIGHRIKSKDNPDKRVEILKKYIIEYFPKMETTSFALMVEEITLSKRNNLILKVLTLYFLSFLNSAFLNLKKLFVTI